SNIGSCEYQFTIDDCKLPTPKAINGLAAEGVLDNGSLTLPAEWFDADSYDNCELAGLWIATPSGGPGQTTPPAGITQSVTFNCDNLGTNTVDLWAQDVAGNWDYVSTYVIIQDNQGTCGNTGAGISGAVESELAEAAENVTVMVDGNMSGLPDPEITGVSGEYGFPSLPVGQNYTVTPEKVDEIREGLSTLDLVLIARHLVGLGQLNSPYKLIAADVNNDQEVGVFDLVDLQRVIIFIYDEFPNEQTSYRFVDAAYNFPNENNPFESTFPEIYSVNNLQGEETADFVAIKTGDVNNSAQMNAQSLAFDRSYVGDLKFRVAEREARVGETITVDFTTAEFREIFGYQFTMDIDPSLKLIDAQAMETSVVFGTSLLDEGKLTASWGENHASSFEDDAVLFSLSFEVLRDGMLSEMLSISNSEQYTRAEAYTNEFDHLDLSLEFTNGEGAIVEVAKASFELFQNQPNPFKDETEISFVLPYAGEATLSIYDLSGRILKVIEGDYAKGYNKETINRSELGGAGVLYYQLDFDQERARRKMILIK
ncbi:MAG: T9SS type A sorting domain-containing protein, partial [Saprospiraceae bacterium]|nr:T9SS type A sorting domain-containing protein [Saprospiraceae bacterium]